MKVIGIDIGTTSICGISVDTESGRVLKSETLPNDAFIKTDFEFERIQDPEKIMNRVFEILSRLEPQNASAIGFSGQMHGIVYTDKNGNTHTVYGDLVTVAA